MESEAGGADHGGRLMRPPVGAGAPPIRVDGYAPIRDYAAIGDGRTVALVARDGSIDWLPLPNLDSSSVFGAILDAERGGSFRLAPEGPFTVDRRYRPGTNILETTFRTDTGAVRVTDALTLPDRRLGPTRELQRRVDGLSGRVPLRWRVEPRFGYAERQVRIGRRSGVPVASTAGSSLAVRAYDAGEAEIGRREIAGRFEAVAGSSATIALCSADQEPLVFPVREELETRLERTAASWREWAEGRSHSGLWQEEVLRSILALKLLVFAPSGAVAAAATTSLPEAVGGERNWDYRFSWVRDSVFTLDAFLELGCPREAHAYFWWLMHSSQLAHPRLQVLYRLDGGRHAPERELGLAGYRGSRPVRVGNAAAGQLQLDTYGELLQTSWLYALAGNRIDRDVGSRLAEIADLVCDIWRQPDAGIWEVRSAPLHFTQSKMMCWVAIDRAIRLAERGVLPAGRTRRWRREREAIREFVESRCWSEEKRSYTRSAGGEDLDASLLLAVLFGYGEENADRLAATVEAVRRELADGPFVLRYCGEDGLSGSEGAFLTCSFWLAEALAKVGRADEAADLMDQLVALANDVGLYAEELDPETRGFLGNIPQALSHLALIRAAVAIGSEAGR
jgi:GH15 family glucan-1,4-alpha-glucosidase